MKELKDALGILALFAVCAFLLLEVVILKTPLGRKVLMTTPLGRKVFIVDGMQVNLKDEYKSFVGWVVFWVVLVPWVLFFITAFISFTITTIFPESRWAYAMKYDTESQYVGIVPKPHDCEFSKAPIGSKYCHFEKNVITRTENLSVGPKTYVYVSWNKVAD